MNNTDNKQNTALPKLRFPEFRTAGSWIEYHLSEISSRIVKKVGALSLTPISITAGEGFVSQVEKFGRDISGQQYKNYLILNKGEFAYNKGNSKKYPQGCIYKLKEFEQVAAPNAFICFRLTNNHVANFYQGYFDANAHGKQLQRFITSGARSDGLLNVSPLDFFSIKFLSPKKEEQQKIADCLSSVDELITAQSQKIESLQKHKKGLMQQLFPAEGETVPRVRFAEFHKEAHWDNKTIGEVCSLFSGGTPHTSNKEYYGGRIPFIRSAEIDKNYTDLHLTTEGLKNSAAKLVCKGDILFALYGANSGEVALAKLEGAINQAVLCLKSKIDNRFIYQYLLSVKSKIISKYIQGGQGNLSGEIVKSVEISIPFLPKEQQKIADCLSSLDELITTETQKLDLFKTHKKGLMQQLFPAMDEVSA